MINFPKKTKKVRLIIMSIAFVLLLGLSYNTAEARSSKKTVQKKTTVKVDGVKVTVKLSCNDDCNGAKKKFESTVKKAVAAAKKGEDFKMKASCSNTSWSIKISGKPKSSSPVSYVAPRPSSGGSPGGSLPTGGNNNGGNGTLTCVGSQCAAGGASCVNGAPCQAATANSCGLNIGTADCAAGICVPPPDAICDQVCTGPDGVLIGPGESRVYYSDSGDCGYDARTCQADGSLSGDNVYSLSKPRTGCSAEGTPPVISRFRMVPNTVGKNNSCLMTWDVQNALNCTVSGPNFGAGFDAYTGSSSMPTAPITFSSTYTLTCSNASGSASKSAICYMNPEVNER